MGLQSPGTPAQNFVILVGLLAVVAYGVFREPLRDGPERCSVCSQPMKLVRESINWDASMALHLLVAEVPSSLPRVNLKELDLGVVLIS